MYNLIVGSLTRSPIASHVVRTHLGSYGVGAGSCSMDQLEEGEQVEVDFHPHYHHLKKKPK
jgi:hypothetical protein